MFSWCEWGISETRSKPPSGPTTSPTLLQVGHFKDQIFDQLCTSFVLPCFQVSVFKFVKNKQHSINNHFVRLTFCIRKLHAFYIFTHSFQCSEQQSRCLEIFQLSRTHLPSFFKNIIHSRVCVEFHFKCLTGDRQETCFSLADEDDTNSRRADILKSLPSRQLSLSQRRARREMPGKDRPRSHGYEAVNNEDSDDEQRMDEATSSTKEKFEQTEPLSARLMKLRKRR